jgi:hypothetical protein
MQANFWWAVAGTALLAVAAKMSDGQDALLYTVTYFAVRARLDAAAPPPTTPAGG